MRLHWSSTWCLAGLAGCLLLYLAVAVLEGFTMYVLAKLAERYDAESYGSLVRKALGRKTSAIQAAVMIIYLWGSSLSYLVRSNSGWIVLTQHKQQPTSQLQCHFVAVSQLLHAMHTVIAAARHVHTALLWPLMVGNRQAALECQRLSSHTAACLGAACLCWCTRSLLQTRSPVYHCCTLGLRRRRLSGM